MSIRSISARDAWARLARGEARIIDVREPHEQALGVAPDAWRIPPPSLSRHPGLAACRPDAALMLICASGARSRAAAGILLAEGFSDVASVEGGMAAWRAAGLPVESGGLDPAWADRYSRQIKLPEVGIAGQRKLEDARVLIVGAGGLGSPIALYLAAAGVGRIRLVDDDRVERSNLQRQVLHAEARIGMRKVDSALETLCALNPAIAVEPVVGRLDESTIEALLDGVDVAVDGSDNLATRYLLNRGCVRRAVPLVYGAVQGFEGQVGVFHPAADAPEMPCYNCLFPERPGVAPLPNCAEAGVLGVVPGTIGLLQATEVLKLLLGVGASLAGTLLHVDLSTADFRRLAIRADPACEVCQKRAG
ncbi:molybdopterin-synthase adenylyltransferase MoeB [Solilutibacter pythonis]|uniref:molybdopterin-synthase adenylyltransferase MoeB n=1 Tax=Solilutibacter pythonis TaxID=2483112 RepID=UPI0013140FDC|nr:molybdopterin-synthase adenylyltransferase MoeB [Lysobacter pythonis]